MEAVDILFDTDIAIVNGDLDVGKSDQQHIEHIFTARPGQFYQHPTLGIAIDLYRHGTVHRATLQQRIRTQLEADNYRINKIEVGGDIDELLTSVDATRKS